MTTQTGTEILLHAPDFSKFWIHFWSSQVVWSFRYVFVTMLAVTQTLINSILVKPVLRLLQDLNPTGLTIIFIQRVPRNQCNAKGIRVR